MVALIKEVSMTNREHKSLERTRTEPAAGTMIGNLALVILIIIFAVLILAPVDAWKW